MLVSSELGTLEVRKAGKWGDGFFIVTSPAIRPSYRSSGPSGLLPVCVARAAPDQPWPGRASDLFVNAVVRYLGPRPRPVAYVTSAAFVRPRPSILAMFSHSAAAPLSLQRSILGHKRRLMENLRRFSSLKLESSILPLAAALALCLSVRLPRIGHLRHVRKEGGREEGALSDLSLYQWWRWLVANKS